MATLKGFIFKFQAVHYPCVPRPMSVGLGYVIMAILSSGIPPLLQAQDSSNNNRTKTKTEKKKSSLKISQSSYKVIGNNSTNENTPVLHGKPVLSRTNWPGSCTPELLVFG